MIREWFQSRWNPISRRLGELGGNAFSSMRSRWLEAIYIFAIVLLTAGIVDAGVQPVSFGYVVFPSTAAQSATETVIDAFAMLMGAAGIYLSYLSGRQTTRARMVNFYLAIGVLMITISVYIGLYVLLAK